MLIELHNIFSLLPTYLPTCQQYDSACNTDNKAHKEVRFSIKYHLQSASMPPYHMADDLTLLLTCCETSGYISSPYARSIRSVLNAPSLSCSLALSYCLIFTSSSIFWSCCCTPYTQHPNVPWCSHAAYAVLQEHTPVGMAGVQNKQPCKNLTMADMATMPYIACVIVYTVVST